MKTLLQRITALQTKADAIILYREIENNQTLLFSKLAQAMNYTRQISYHWDEQLPDHTKDEIIGFLTRKLEKKNNV